MLTLTPAQRAQLRAAAHALKPFVLIGENGLTPAVLREIDQNLAAHSLIKVRIFSDERETRLAMNQEICAQLHAAPVQQLGKLLVLYREGKTVLDLQQNELPSRRIAEKQSKASASPRTVVIRKPAKTAQRRPKTQKIKLLGNERVTAGGNVKRAKPRQKSLKKQALI